jgi:hypothetical protein
LEYDIRFEGKSARRVAVGDAAAGGPVETGIDEMLQYKM